MKKSVSLMLSSCMALAALVSISSCEKLGNLTLSLENPAEGGVNLSIYQGETLEIPFKIGQLDEYTAAVSATCDNADYSVEAVLEGGKSTGKIIITAPEFIFEGTTIQIELTAVDAENSRTVKQTIEVTAECVLQKLSAASNCHLTSPGAFISFATVKGNSTEKIENIAKAELLWEDAVDLVDSVFTLDGKDMYVVLDDEKQGNAVVAAKNAEGTILWSWHIWVSQEDATAVSMPYTYTPAEGESLSFEFMDRNIGALTSQLGTADANGCLYQWGRKDPFPAPMHDGTLKNIYDSLGAETEISTANTDAANNIENSIQNPMTRYNGVSAGNYSWITNDVANFSKDMISDLWGGVSKKKSVYDPCPAGYKVPQCAAWQFLSDSTIEKVKVYREGAPEAPANSDQLGKKVTIGNKDFFFPAQGEANQRSSLEAGYTNGYGVPGNNWPCGKLWSSQFDGNYDGTAAKKSYFRAYTNNITPTSTSYYANFNLGYAVGVRCIKE